MSTVRGAVPQMAEIGRMAGEAMEGWLREYEGYRGLLVLTTEEGEQAHVITLWETREAEQASRATRASLRDKLAATAGMEVVGMEPYDMPVCEIIPEDDPAG
jgi:heme-degrading monooxygenase HmoA